MNFKPLRSGVLVLPETTEEKKTKSGLIIAHNAFDDYDRLKSLSRFGIVFSKGDDCKYLNECDRVIYAKGSQWCEIEEEGKKYLYFNEEKNILARINADKSYDIHPDYVLVKINKKDRDGLFSKTITRNDGSTVELFLNVPAEGSDERSSKFFVETGEILLAGENVTVAQKGDLCVFDYTVDNSEHNIIGYEGDDKLVVINAVTTRHQSDEIVYANKRTPKDTIVAFKGDYDVVSQLLGVVRNQKLYSVDPYVFLDHRKNIVQMKTKSGITYEEKQMAVQREVLSVAPYSKKAFKISEGRSVLIMDHDIFDVVIDGKTISCANDRDVMMGV